MLIGVPFQRLPDLGCPRSNALRFAFFEHLVAVARDHEPLEQLCAGL